MRRPKCVPADEWRIAEWIAKVSGLQQYEVVSIDDQGAEIRYLPDEVGRALTEFHREAVVDFEQLLEEASKDDEPPADWKDKVLDACDAIDRARELDHVDQTDPVLPPKEVLVEYTDEEPTVTAEVDNRFDDSDKEEG